MKLLLTTILLANLTSAAPATPPSNPLLAARQTGACLQQCLPLPPPQTDAQRCDATTSCVPLASGKTYCACRAGYRGSTGAPPDDTGVQFRLDGIGQDGRVFVSPGLACGQLCDEWYLGAQGCREVAARSDCA